MLPRFYASVILFVALPVLAWAEQVLPRDKWHMLTPDSPLYSSVLDGYHGAALVQTNGVSAIFVLGNETRGAVVTLRFPGWTKAQSLTSELIMPAGNILKRAVESDHLTAHPSVDNDALDVSFAITHDDLPLFRRAVKWRLSDGENSVTITLNGSSRAIREALEAQSTDRAKTASAVPELSEG